MRLHISIHPPRTGWDKTVSPDFLYLAYFNPPTPYGVGLGIFDSFGFSPNISIHPPRTGWDFNAILIIIDQVYFNPPTPYGVGPVKRPLPANWLIFQSTHPVRGGTCNFQPMPQPIYISIHPPRTGWDQHSLYNFPRLHKFQSTHPVRGGTLKKSPHTTSQRYFNPPTPYGVGRICSNQQRLS